MRRKETPGEDLERYSLYRTVAEEDPFPYSDSLHLDFLAGGLHNILSDRTDVTLPEDVAGRLEGFVDGIETR